MILASLLFLAWGSYLNSLAYRLLNEQYFFKTRSFCPSCHTTISWYDNIPVISWFFLQAQCRFCKQSISPLYPFIEIITPLSLLCLYFTVQPIYFPIYFLFFSALIVSIRTDLQSMLISRYVTLYAIPLSLIAAYFHRLPISLTTALLGAIFGYTLLLIVQSISFYLTNQECLGQGDLELLAFIGSCTGPLGCWFSVLIGSTVGSCIMILYMLWINKKISLIPFGTFLSFGAIIYVLYEQSFLLYFT